MATAKKTTVKIVSPKDLRAMDAAALTAQIAELKKQLAEQFRANRANELPSTAVIAKTRKSIARALTIANQKQREQSTPSKETK